MSQPPLALHRSPAAWFAAAAAALPSLLAYNVAPSPTFLNQALAFALWPGFVLACAPAATRRGPGPLYAALAVLALAAAWSWGPGALPASLALSAIGSLLAAAVMVAGGASARAADVRPAPDASAGEDRAVDGFACFCWGWVVAGAFNVGVAVVQVFWPELPDGN